MTDKDLAAKFPVPAGARDDLRARRRRLPAAHPAISGDPGPARARPSMRCWSATPTPRPRSTTSRARPRSCFEGCAAGARCRSRPAARSSSRRSVRRRSSMSWSSGSADAAGRLVQRFRLQPAASGAAPLRGFGQLRHPCSGSRVPKRFSEHDPVLAVRRLLEFAAGLGIALLLWREAASTRSASPCCSCP